MQDTLGNKFEHFRLNKQILTYFPPTAQKYVYDEPIPARTNVGSFSLKTGWKSDTMAANRNNSKINNVHLKGCKI